MPEQSDPTPALPDASAWLDDHGDALYRYAVLHIGHQATAEDLVQETLLAALRSYERYRGDSTVRTWLTGILKHKILDHARKAGRAATEADLNQSIEFVSDHFNAKGLWQDAPHKWGRRPDRAFEQQEFWQAFTRCLSGLPEQMRTAFTLRELDGTDTEELCKLLDTTATNIWTLLHRARSRLRACLEQNWFRREDA